MALAFRTLLLAGVFSVSALAGFPHTASPGISRPWATRAFFSTPHGQIHYAFGGDDNIDGLRTWRRPPLVLFHSHPRSISEFKYLLDELQPTPFVAFDYFGFGSSDDCLTCNASLNEYVSIDEFAEYASQVLTALGVEQYDALGSLKGCAIATNLAAKDHRVRSLILANPAYWLPDVVAKIRSYMNVIKNPVLQPDGSHLIQTWNDTSANPLPYLPLMEEKTIDELRAYFVGWQYVLAELDNNNNTLPALKAFGGKTLLLWGGVALAIEDLFGFHTVQFRRMIEEAVRDKQIEEFEFGNEGMMAANATELAPIIAKFLS